MMCTAEKTYHTYLYIMQNTNNILLESRRSSSGVGGGEGGVHPTPRSTPESLLMNKAVSKSLGTDLHYL